MKTVSHTRKSGFTLIELSIVLVIIGLIVGGVLVGQDLIKAAEVRATVSQIEKYDAAANTFRSKYNTIPGDVVTPQNYGLTSEGIGGASVDSGDGDGYLDRTADDANDLDSESAAFFRHLSQANLVGDTITASDFVRTALDDEATVFPVLKVGTGTRIAAYGASGVHYYVMSVLALENGEITITDGTAMPVITAYNIDVKVDDGNPSTGKATAVTSLTAADTGAGAGADECVDSTGDDLYQTATSARANDTECSLRVRTAF